MLKCLVATEYVLTSAFPLKMTPIVECHNRKNQNFERMYNRADSTPCIRIGVLACTSSICSCRYISISSISTVPSAKIAAAADRTNWYIKIQWIKKFDDFMYVVYGIIAACFQHFMSTLSKDLSDSAKEERIGRACNKSRRGDVTRRLCIFHAFFFLCQRSW
jgi:hypothetical protein